MRIKIYIRYTVLITFLNFKSKIFIKERKKSSSKDNQLVLKNERVSFNLF